MSVAPPRRRLLVVSHVFPPLVAGGAARMGQFAKLLPEFGWDVTVLTGQHRSSVAIDNAAIDALQGRTKIVRAWSPTSTVATRGRAVPRHGLKSLIRRALRTTIMSMMFPDREILWVPAAVSAGRKALSEQPHDAVLATYSPGTNLIVGRMLARAFNLPFLVDFRDLWATLPVESAFVSRAHRAAALKLEGSLVRTASRIIAVAPKMASSIAASHGVADDKAVSITNGFDPSDAARAVDRRPAEPRPFRLVYTGSVHALYNLDPFWHAIRALADRKVITPESLRIEFVGNLSIDDVRRHGLESFVEIYPFVPHEKVFDALATADALFVVETPGYYAEFSYAAKVFDYLLTGKPVLALVESGGNTYRLLEAAGVGYCADADDPAGLQKQIERVLALKGATPRAVDPEAPPLRDFNRRWLVKRLAHVLDEVVTAEPRGTWNS